MIQWCGLFAKEASATRYAWHNGEGVYIGTSPKSTDQPMYAGDTSSGNVVSGNVAGVTGGLLSLVGTAIGILGSSC